MKRTVAIVVIAVALIAFLVVWLMGPSVKTWKPATQMTFLGFTNTVAGAPATNALFGFTQIPAEASSWETIEVSHWDGTDWVVWNSTAARWFDWARPETLSGDYQLRGLVRVPVPSRPTRVVLRLTRIPTGFWNTVGNAVEPVARRLNLDSSALFRSDPEHYFMTNEFNFPPAAQFP